MEERDIEVIILIKAINDTFSQTVYSRHSYKPHQMDEQAKFKPLKQEVGENGRIEIFVEDIHYYDKLN